MSNVCGYCGGETDTGMNCIKGCDNVRPAKVIYTGRSKPTPLHYDPDYDESANALKEHLVADKDRDALFGEMVEFVRYSVGPCLLSAPYTCNNCNTCKANALLTKIEEQEG